MPTPQPGIFAQGSRRHRHLELDLRPDATDDGIAGAIAEVLDLFIHPGGINVVVGFGPALWARLAADDDLPVDLRDFDVAGLPATQHDLWLWLHGSDDGVLFDTALAAAQHLAAVATLASDIEGFVYRDSRDLIGFVDGTENPGMDEVVEVAIVPDGEPGAGGSHVLLQRWVHRLAEFRALPVEAQERIVGRTKLDDRELDPRPPDSHLGRVVVHDPDGEELELYRRSVPYGTVGEHGLQFVAFSADPDRVRVMLARMFGHAGDGLHDRLTDFTSPVTGANYFVPPVDLLPFAGSDA